jgi:predicted transcriptional regulator of viral defense system
MKFEDFIEKIGALPVIDTETLLAGAQKKQRAIQVQIARWKKAGKLIKLRRGIYLLSAPYRKVNVYEPYLASTLVKPSYLSMEKALEYHGMIPEAVPVFTSVTTKRPGKFVTSVGSFDYRHVQTSLFWGYGSVSVNQQTAFIASPEKALLDLIYLKGRKISSAYLEELRLQNFKKISRRKLLECAKRFRRKDMMEAARLISRFASSNKEKRL